MFVRWKQKICLTLAIMLGCITFPSVLHAADNDQDNKQRPSGILQSAGAYMEKGLDTHSKNKVTVLVQLREEPYAPLTITSDEKKGRVTLSSVKKAISSQQSDMERAAQKEGLDLEIDRRFDTLVNMVEMTLPADQIPELARLPHVRSIHVNKVMKMKAEPAMEVPPFAADPQAAHKQIGVMKVWEDGYTGKRVKVGVIDSGIDYLHPDLKNAYKGGYDFLDDDKDPYEELPFEGLNPSDHGTMVAGIIAGQGENADAPSPVKGIAYDANLYMYRISSDRGGDLAYTSADLIAAVERAVKDGMDVINLSLAGNSMEVTDSLSPEAVAVNNAMLMGVTVVVAAGNVSTEDEYYYRVGEPGNALFPITVGLSSIETKQLRLQATTSLGETHTLLVNHWFGTDFSIDQPLPLAYANLGTVSDFDKADVAGKIAVVSRGQIPMLEKLSNAADANALGVILFDGADLDSDGQADLDQSDYRGYIESVVLSEVYNYNPFDLPLLLMTGAEGRQMAKELLARKASDPITIQFTDKEVRVLNAGDRVYDFSSRGPVTSNYWIKPDVVAPGQPLLTTLPTYGKGTKEAGDYSYAYRYGGGTSAASPVVTASVALIKQAHPDWTPFDIKAALANTAKSLENGEGIRYDVYSQGAGSIQVDKAIQTPALLQTVEAATNLNSKLLPVPVTYFGDNISFGSIAPGTQDAGAKLQLKNTSKKSLSYKAKVVKHDRVTGDPKKPAETPDVDDLDVALSQKTIRVSGNKTASFDLKLSVPKNAEEGVYEGEVVLTNSQGYPDLHLPFVVHVGDHPVKTPAGFSDVHFSSRIWTPNRDGKDDTLEVSAHLDTDEANVIVMVAEDEENGYVYPLDLLNEMDEEGNPTYSLLPEGAITFADLDGTYLVDLMSSTERKPLRDGRYKVYLRSAYIDPLTMKITELGEFYQYVTVKNSNQRPDKETLKREVEEAAAAFQPLAVNTKLIGEHVLYMPNEPLSVEYAVTGSSALPYINTKGILRALPEESKTVRLKVKVTSKVDKRVYAYTFVDVAVQR